MLHIAPVGWALSLFLVISYVVWLIFAFAIGGGMLSMMGWHMGSAGIAGAIIAGLVGSFLCGWYVAAVFVPLYNYFSRRNM